MNQVFEFEGYCLDAGRRALLRDGHPVPLTPKAFDTLLVLVRHAGSLVGKDQLLQEVWPDTFVEEATLTQNISTLRKALGRGPGGRQLIETVPKHGYRFTAQVNEVRDDPAAVLVVRKVTRTRIVAEESEASGDGADQESYGAPGDVRQAQLISDTQAPPRRAMAGDSSPSARKWLGLPGRVVLLPVLLSALAAAVFVGVKFFGPGKPPGDVEPPFQHMHLTKLTHNGNVVRAALSPDGSYTAYAINEGGRQSLWLRQVSATNSVQIVAPKEVDYLGITFSREGGNIFFATREMDSPVGILYQVPLLGGTPRKVLEDTDSGVALSPDGQQFAFIRQIPCHGEGALMVANVDGTGAQAVVVRRRPDTLSDRAIAWAPDGKAIVHAVRVEDNINPYMMLVEVRLHDRSVKALTQEKWAWIGEVAWLKDGGGLIFNAIETLASDGSAKLWRLSHGDGKVSKLTNDLNNYDGVSLTQNNGALASVQTYRLANFWSVPVAAPGHGTRITSGASDQQGERMSVTWSPDGQIVFGSTAGGNPDVWLMDADGKNQRQLTFDPRPDTRPAVSPDGRFIVFVSWRTGTPHLWRMDSDANNPRQLTDGETESSPDISPDGRWVVYQHVSRGRPTLWRVPLEGGASVKINDDVAYLPAVSPDGKLIAYFQSQITSPVPKLAVTPFAGGAPVKTFDLPAEIYPPAGIRWTRDGRALSYVVNEGRVSNVWVRPLDNSTPRKVTDFSSDQIYRFAWSPDAKHLMVERGVDVNDVVLISADTKKQTVRPRLDDDLLTIKRFPHPPNKHPGPILKH